MTASTLTVQQLAIEAVEVTDVNIEEVSGSPHEATIVTIKPKPADLVRNPIHRQAVASLTADQPETTCLPVISVNPSCHVKLIDHCWIQQLQLQDANGHIQL